MAKVFISYSRKDIDFAKRLTTELQKSELDFWIDWEGIPPTVDWWREIEKGIEEADVFIFLISPDSAKSKVCGQEIDSAVQNGKRLIPLVVREIKGEEAPEQLSHLNWIFFRESDDFNAAVKKLLTAIHTDYEWVQAHRRLQVKSLEWERSGREKSFLLRGKDLEDAEAELARNTSKEPHPTDLQREYVFESRKVADRQRRQTTIISTVGVIALAILAVFGFVQAGNATSQANAAKTAQANAEFAQGTAIANEQEAIRQKAQAEAESRRALSGQLALEAKSVVDQYPQRAQLLGLEALAVNIEAGEETSPIAEEALRAANSKVNGIGLPGFAFEVTYLQFTSDNRYLFAGSEYSGEFRVWDLDNLKNPGNFVFDLNLEADIGIDILDAYLSDDEQWFVVEKRKDHWNEAGDDYTTVLEQSVMVPISGLDSGVTPLYINGPIQFLDEQHTFLETQEDQTTLWIFDIKDLEARKSYNLEGAYAAHSLDNRIIATETITRDELTLQIWDIGYDFTTAPQMIDEAKFKISDRDSLQIRPATRGIAAFVLNEDMVNVRLFREPGFDNLPDTLELPSTKDFYFIQTSPQETWAKIVVSESEIYNWVRETYLVDLKDNASIRVIPEDEYVFNDGSFILDDGWYVDVYQNDIDASYYMEYQFFNLRDWDFEPEATHQFPIVFYDFPKWDITVDAAGTWLRYGNHDAFNAEAFSSNGELITIPTLVKEGDELPFEERLYWYDIPRRGFEDNVVVEATSPDNEWRAEGSYSGSLRLWNMNEESVYLLTPISEDEYNTNMMLSSDGKWLTTASELVQLNDDGLPAGRPIQYAQGQVRDAVFSPDSKWLLYFTGPGNVSMIDLQEFAKNSSSGNYSIILPETYPEELSFSPDGRWLIASSYSPGSNTALLDLTRPQNLTWHIVPESGRSEIIFTPDDRYIVIHSTSTGNEFGSLPANAPFYGTHVTYWTIPDSTSNEPAQAAKFEFEELSRISSNGYLLIDDNNLIWDLQCLLQDNTCPPITVEESADSYYAYFSPDSRYLIVELYEENEWRAYQYQLWDLQEAGNPDNVNPKLLLEFPNTESWPRYYTWEIVQPVTGTIYLYGGGGGGAGGEFGTYKVDYGVEILEPSPSDGSIHSMILRGHEGSLYWNLVSRSGKYALTISEDSVKLWNLDAVRADPFTSPVNLPIDSSTISYLGFTINERWVVFVTNDGRMEFHPMSVETMMAQACRSVGRNFIINEWQRYFLSADYEKTCENLPEHPSVPLESRSIP